MRALQREHNDRAWLAWHIEALHRSKRLPRLDTLTARRPMKRHQSSAEFWEILRAHVLASGGKVH